MTTVNLALPKVNDIHQHMAAAIEQGYFWFHFSDCVSTKDYGYRKAKVTLDDEEDGTFVATNEMDRARVLADLAGAVTPKTGFPVTQPDGWDEGRPYWTLDGKLFRLGLARYRQQHGDTSTVRHLGNGEWDIDAHGADAIVQYALFGGLIFG